jgi:hypothetical protein
MNKHKLFVQFSDRGTEITHLWKPVRERWRRMHNEPAIKTSPAAASALTEIERNYWELSFLQDYIETSSQPTSSVASWA